MRFMKHAADQRCPGSVGAGAGADATAVVRVSRVARLATLFTIILPFLGLVTTIVFMWGGGFRWIDLGLLLGMYAMTVLGVTVGFHRHFTHRSFETGRVMQFALSA